MNWILNALAIQTITCFVVFGLLYIYIRIDEYFFYKKIRKNNDKNKRKNQTC